MTVFQANSGQNPNVFNTKVNGVDAYATSDLLAPHPTKEGLWTVFGRVDDQIMHSTGEKVGLIDLSFQVLVNNELLFHRQIWGH